MNKHWKQNKQNPAINSNFINWPFWWPNVKLDVSKVNSCRTFFSLDPSNPSTLVCKTKTPCCGPSNWKIRSVNLSSNILQHHIPFGIFWDILWCSPLLLAIYDLPKRCHPNHPTLRKTSNTFVQKTRLAESPLHKVSWSKPQKMPSRIFIPAPPVSWAIVGITKTTQRPIYSWYIFFLMI